MQMLQQYLGEQGARYATFVLTALLLVIAILIVWVLIRKALGSRLNFSDKPDRRGRAPRLGITESFNVDREGRRLVIVRRDNFEHLVMIGGPNDVVIETTILRGERLTVGRNDQRLQEPETISALPRPVTETLQPALAAPLPMPTVQPTPVQKVSVHPAQAQLPIQPRVTPLPPEPRVATPTPPPVPMPRPVTPAPAPAPVRAPEVKAEVIVKAPEPVVTPAPLQPVLPSVELPKAPVVGLPNVSAIAAVSSMAAPVLGVAATAKAAMSKILSPKAKVEEPAMPTTEALIPPVVAIEMPAVDKTVASKPTLTERIKTSAFFAKKEAISEPVSAPPPPPVASTRPAPVAPPAPVVAKPVENAFAMEMRQLEEAARIMKAPAAPVAEFSNVVQTPRPAVMPPRPSAPAPSQMPSAQPVARVASKNPFDSLEEEMAKLLGRTPDGKG